MSSLTQISKVSERINGAPTGQLIFCDIYFVHFSLCGFFLMVTSHYLSPQISFFFHHEQMESFSQNSFFFPYKTQHFGMTKFGFSMKMTSKLKTNLVLVHLFFSPHFYYPTFRFGGGRRKTYIYMFQQSHHLNYQH